MKKLLLSLLVVVVLVIAGALIAPSFINWNSYKPEIAAQAKKYTGRDLDIRGDIALQVLPTPGLRAQDIALSNLEGGSAPEMLQLEALEISLDLRALLAMEVQVSGVTLVRPQVLLEVMPDGRANWALGPQQAAWQQMPGQKVQVLPVQQAAASSSLEISLDQVTIEAGTVVFKDHVSGLTEQAEEINALLSADSLQGPFTGQGSLVLRGNTVTFDGKSGRLPMAAPRLPGQTSKASPLQVKLGLPDAGDARVTFTGGMQMGSQNNLVLAGKLEGSGENLAQIAALAQPGAALPPLLAQDYSLDSKIGYDGASFEAEDLDLQLGKSQLTGKVKAELGERPYVTATLASAQLDLDDLLAKSASGAAGGGGGASTEGGLDTLVLPDSFDADLELEVDALRFQNQVVRQLQFDGNLSNGQINITRATALLPGGADLSLVGKVTADGKGPQFNGRLESSADNLRALLTWFSLPVDQVPSDRLRRFSLRTRIQADSKVASFQELDLELDTTRVSGAATVALRQKPGLGIGLAVDRLNLDAYLPKQGAKGGGGGQATAPGSGAASALDQFDANLNLKVGELTYGGQNFKNLTVDGTVQDGDVVLRQTAFEGLGGGKVTFAGKISGLPEQPELAGGKLSAVYGDSRKLAQIAGQNADSPLARLGAFRLNGTLSGNLNAVTYDLTSQVLGGEILTSGKLLDVLAAPQVEGGKLTVAQITGGELQRLLALPDDSPLARLGPIDLSSQFSGGAKALTYDSQVSVLGGTLAAKGSAEGMADLVPEFDFTTSVSHPQPARFLKDLTGESALSNQAGPLAFKGRIQGSALRFTVSEIDASVGPTQITGEVKTSLVGKRPDIQANLAVGQLPLDQLLAKGGGGGGQAVDNRWSRAPLDLSALKAIDGQLDVTVVKLTSNGLKLEKVISKTKLSDGLVDIEQLDGRLYGGTLSAKGQLDGSSGKGLKSNLDLVVDKTRIHKLLEAAANFNRVEGRLSLNAKLRSNGASEAELVSRLKGQGTLDGDLKARLTKQEKAGAAILTLLGSQVKEVRGVSDTIGTIYQAFGDKPAKLQGGFAIDKGVARPQDLKLVGQNDSVATFSGVLADLPRWGIDTLITLQRKGYDRPDLEVGLRGPLDRPNPRIKDLRLRRNDSQAAPATSGDQSQQQPSGNQPVDPQKVKPEDVIRGLLKGFGKQ
ncbi:AsmA family protein [Rhodovibrionaceae bacterium A322]